MSDILIDDRIRDWVFIPIIIVMFLIQMLKDLIRQYMNARKKCDKMTSKTELTSTIDKNITARSARLARMHSLLPDHSFKMKRAYLCDKEMGVLAKAGQKPAQDPIQQMPNMSPDKMFDMLKNNLSSIVFMTVQYQWISYFFSGFVIGKVPFPLTQKFRTMLQRGVDIQNLDVRYISSISIYFVMLFGGLEKIINLMKDDKNEEETETPMNMGMGMQGAMMPPMGFDNQDNSKLFLAEKGIAIDYIVARLEGVKHTFDLGKFQDKAAKSLKKYINQ